MEKNNFLDFFDFLNSDFTLKEIKIFDYAIYSVFISDKIGIIFSFEFRETMPQIQFTLLDKNLELVNREGIYTLKRKFEKNNFFLKSYYLDEILLGNNNIDYKIFFKDSKTINESIKISVDLMKKYALNFISGDEKYYLKMNEWFRKELSKQSSS